MFQCFFTNGKQKVVDYEILESFENLKENI